MYRLISQSLHAHTGQYHLHFFKNRTLKSTAGTAETCS